VTIKVIDSHTIEAKPFSVNKRIGKEGDRFKDNVEKWKSLFKKYLPDDFLPKDIENYSLRFDFYVVPSSDLDNTLKYVIDSLQEKYEFNDAKILHFTAYKHTVNQTRAIEGVDERFRIKITLTERLFYSDFDNDWKPEEKETLRHTTTDEDYAELYRLATYDEKGKS